MTDGKKKPDDEILQPVALFVGNDEENRGVLVIVQHQSMGTINIPLAKAEAEWFRETLDKAIANVGRKEA